MKPWFDKFGGGRSPSAIYACEDLTANQQSVLLYLAYVTDFNASDGVKFNPVDIDFLARQIRLSPRGTLTAVKKLGKRGYVDVGLLGGDWDSGLGCILTFKVFEEFVRARDEEEAVLHS